jgi:transketolase
MSLSELRQFEADTLNDAQMHEIKIVAAKARRDILKMTTQSGSGHPGGSLSSIDIYIMLWLCANVHPEKWQDENRDRIVVSHGHTSAGVYSTLGNTGFFDVKDAINCFRKNGSIFEGHPSIKVPGVEWCSGSLGQGLSVGCGFALASRMKKQNKHVFVIMGDGEQGKGQIQEAREFAIKFKLNQLTAIIDLNGLQASGGINDIMPQNIAEKYRAAGWKVFTVNGHNYQELYQALKFSYCEKNVPTLILAETVMGKGVSFIENNYEYHGKILTQTQYEKAVIELDCGGEKYNCPSNSLDMSIKEFTCIPPEPVENRVKTGNPKVYEKGGMIDCRSAFGEALYDLAQTNQDSLNVTMAAVDCDLAESVKLQKFGSQFPEGLIECGIQEHNAATVAAAMSKAGVLTFFADFGVFGIDETYGQHRMSDLNNSSLKLVCTHNGLDVGEDGKTHQCIDYISNMSNLFGFKIIIPADANQTDRAIRYAATNPGNIVIAMGRSKLPVLTNEAGEVMFDGEHAFEYGAADWIREGTSGVIVTCGTMVSKAIYAWEKLKNAGISVGILNLSCPVQLDTEKIREAAKTGLIITYEDHNIRTGIGSIIGTYLAETGLSCKFQRVGITSYGVSASPDYQYKAQSMDEDSLTELVQKLLSI